MLKILFWNIWKKVKLNLYLKSFIKINPSGLKLAKGRVKKKKSEKRSHSLDGDIYNFPN